MCDLRYRMWYLKLSIYVCLNFFKPHWSHLCVNFSNFRSCYILNPHMQLIFLALHVVAIRRTNVCVRTHWRFSRNRVTKCLDFEAEMSALRLSVLRSQLTPWTPSGSPGGHRLSPFFPTGRLPGGRSGGNKWPHWCLVRKHDFKGCRMGHVISATWENTHFYLE